MHFLVISKLPEFTPEGEAAPGQCEPYTGGWRLRLKEDGREEDILTGTYYEIRRVQRRCAGKAADEVRKLAADAAEAMKASLSNPPAGDDLNESTQILGMDEVRRAMLEMELTAAIDDLDGTAEWLSVSQQNGVAVASLGAGLESVGADEAAGALHQAFESGGAALVIDLGGRDPAGPGFAGRLRDLAARAEEGGRFLGLVGASPGLEGELGDASSGSPPRLFADLESALAAAAGTHEEEGAAGPPSEDSAREPHED
ncbi:MAG: hypothetical protein ACYS9X_23690 [Planctomycetota bacterium]